MGIRINTLKRVSSFTLNDLRAKTLRTHVAFNRFSIRIPYKGTMVNDTQTGASIGSQMTELVPLLTPVVEATLNKWLVPMIAKVARSKELKKNARPDRLKAGFEEYLIRTYGRLSFMNTIVFGNQQKRIQELYIPLTVRGRGGPDETFEITGWLDEFIPAFKRVIITDTAGMGKSTIMKWLFLSALGMSRGIPIFVELRTLSAKKTLLDRIYEELSSIDQPFDKSLLLLLIRSGEFTFFLDGFDEVAFDDRRAVTEDIQDFISKAFGNHFVIASRHETALASFGEFREFTIRPLVKHEAYSLLRKYDESQEHADALIQELEDSKFEQLQDLLTNPMLVSLLYKAYSYKPKIPFKKHIFYRQVFDALFDMHDSTKGGAFIRKKQCNLDIDEFHLVMRDLGFTTAKMGRIEYEKDAISEIIKTIRERNNTVLFQPSALLSDLITTVPLFNREGEHYKWAHKSVQDYFASQFIALDAKEHLSELLEKIYDSGHSRRFENMLDLFHDADNKSFRRVLLASVLRDYTRHYDSVYRMSYPGVAESLVDERRQLTFGYEIAFVRPTQVRLKKAIESPRMLHELFEPIYSESSFLESGLYVHNHAERRPSFYLLKYQPAGGLLSLLCSKKYSFISRPKRTDLGKVPLGGPFLLTDDPASPFNSSKTFAATNTVLRNVGFYLNIDQVRRTLKVIEEESGGADQLSQLLEDL